MKRIGLRGASWDSLFLSFGRVLTMLFAIISAKMMATGLSLTEYGTYSQANLVSAVGASLIALGLVDALNYYFSGKQADLDTSLRARIVNTVFFLEILIGLILAAGVILGQNLLVDYFENPAVRALLPLTACLPVLTNLTYFYQVLYVGTGKAKLMSVYSLVITLVRIVTIYFAVYVVKNLQLIYIMLVLLDLMQMLVFHVTLAKKGVRIQPLKISKAHIRPIFAYGLPMGIYALTASDSREIGKLVVDRLGTTEDLAIYTNCAKLLPVDIVVTSFALVLVPYIIRYVTEKNREQSLILFSNYLKVGYYSVWILSTMLLIAPQTVISFLYDDKYVPGVAIFVIYVFDGMLRFASMHQVVVASNKTRSLMGYSIVSLALNFGLSIVLYRLLGLIGPAVATLISSLVYTWLVLRKSLKLIDAQYSDILNRKEMCWLVFSLGALWAVCVLIYKGLGALGAHDYVAMILSMAVFGCSALALHFRAIWDVLKKINTFRIA